MAEDTKQPIPPHVPGADRTAREPSREGTGKMPMPQVAPTVAGMPRDGRALTEPGEPGVPAGEDDMLDNAGKKPPGQTD